MNKASARKNLGSCLIYILHKNKADIVGMGFLTSSTGMIVTCFHVIEASLGITENKSLDSDIIPFYFFEEYKTFGKKAKIRTAKISDEFLSFNQGDIALCIYDGKKPKDVNFFPLGKSSNSNYSQTERDQFYAIGYAGRGKLVDVECEGVINSNPSRTSFGFYVKTLIDNDDVVAPGFSGTPVLNLATGNIIGIISWILSPEQITRKQGKLVNVIPSELILKILPKNYILLPADLSLRRKSTLLSKFPRISKSQIFGRSYDLKEFERIFNETTNIISVSGIGGIGKSTFLKFVLDHFFRKKNFSNIVWIDYSYDIPLSFINDATFLESIGLNPAENSLSSPNFDAIRVFNKILNLLRKIEGTNLLIVDGVNEDVYKYLSELSLNESWRTILSSREKLIGVEEFELSFLDFNDSRSTFKYYSEFHYENSEENNASLNKIVKILTGHPLAIEIMAKVYKSVPGLTLQKIEQILSDKGLLSLPETQIKTRYDKVLLDTHIQECLTQAFKLSNLNTFELNLLSYLCLIPPKKITYAIIERLTIGDEKLNNSLGTTLNILEIKGWIKFFKETENSIQKTFSYKYYFHPIVQDAVISQIDKIKLNVYLFIENVSNVLSKYSKDLNLALELQEYPDHLYNRIGVKENIVDFFLLISRYLHFQNYINNSKESKKWIGKWVEYQAFIEEEMNHSTNAIITYAKIVNNISYLMRNHSVSDTINMMNRSLGLMIKKGIILKEDFMKEFLKIHYEIGSLYLSVNNYEGAMAIIHDALNYNFPDNSKVRPIKFFLYNLQFLITYKQKKFHDSLEVLDIIEKQFKIEIEKSLSSTERIKVYIQAASICFEIQQFARCETYLDHALESASGVNELYFNKIAYQCAKIYRLLGEVNKAIQILKDRLENNKVDEVGYENGDELSLYIAHCYTIKDEKAEVEKYYNFFVHHFQRFSKNILKKPILLTSILMLEATILRYLNKYTASALKSNLALEILEKNTSNKIFPLSYRLKVLNSCALDCISLYNRTDSNIVGFDLNNIFKQFSENLSELEASHNFNQYTLGVYFDTLGQVLFTLGQKEHSLKMFNKALNLIHNFFQGRQEHYEIQNISNRIDTLFE